MEAGGSVEMVKRIVELEVECGRLKIKSVELEMEVELERQKKKDKCAKLKETINSKERKRKEENDKVWEKYTNLEVQKRKLEIDLKASICKGDDMVRKLKLIEGVIVFQNKSIAEKDDIFKDLLKKHEDLEKGYHINNVVEPENRLREAQVERMLGEVQFKIYDLQKRIKVCQKEKRVMQDKVVKLEKKNSEIKSVLLENLESKEEVFGRVKSLEEENREIKSKVMEMNAEITNEKMAAQAEKRAFEEEKRKMVAKVMEMNADNDKEKIAFKEEKRELEAKVMKMRAEIATGKFAAQSERMAFEEKEKKIEAKLTWLNRLLKEKGEEMCKDCGAKEDVIQFLNKDNETLEAQLKMVKSDLHFKKAILEIKREKDEECSRSSK